MVEKEIQKNNSTYVSCESEISRNYYRLNQELLNSKHELTKLRKKSLSTRNLKILASYIRSGALSRIKRRFKMTVSRPRKIDKGYSLRNYKSYPSVKVVVYTCIWGKYDSIVEPLYVNPNVDYCIITDQNVPLTSKWKKVNLPNIEAMKDMTSIEINRYCKMLPHNIFPQYDYSIYIDGNILIVTDVMPLISDLGNKILGIHSYPVDCIFNMKDAIIAAKKAKRKDVELQINKYKQEGFPDHFGAFECNILIRKHMEEECIKIMNDWWREFDETTSKRDQLSLPYVLWKNGKSAEYVYSLGLDVRLNPRFQLAVEHLK